MNWFKLLKEWKIIIMILALIFSILVINPKTDTNGVQVTSVSEPATGFVYEGMIIIGINGQAVSNLSDYENAVMNINQGDRVTFTYKTGDTTSATTYPYLVTQENNQTILGISVTSVPFSNLEFGLDLSGGTKVILKPERVVSEEELANIIGILEQRLNVYGFKEIPINTLSDFEGNSYIKVELPSSISVEQVRILLESEGVFEARIGNNTVFSGDDILSVCITGVDCTSGIRAAGGGFIFQFGITISESGANNFANTTSELDLETLGSTCYLNDSLIFYLDGEILEGSELKISCDLQGVSERNPSISGGAETIDEARENMKELKSMLQTSNLPVRLNIESVEVISPNLGQEFLENIVFVFLIAIIGVDIIIALRYRNFKIALPIIFVTLSEIIITLGVATLFSWTFDLSAIAGLIASVGTGVDDQIMITDEVLSKDEEKKRGLGHRIKQAFFIVFAVFFTSIALMIPLAIWGVGLLRGFATTTIIAISVGVLITRPAYARMLEVIMKSS